MINILNLSLGRFMRCSNLFWSQYPSAHAFECFRTICVPMQGMFLVFPLEKRGTPVCFIVQYNPEFFFKFYYFSDTIFVDIGKHSYYYCQLKTLILVSQVDTHEYKCWLSSNSNKSYIVQQYNWGIFPKSLKIFYSITK